ncbi:MAG TPA: pitrilysin family protein [Longimicrobiales bacterium]
MSRAATVPRRFAGMIALLAAGALGGCAAGGASAGAAEIAVPPGLPPIGKAAVEALEYPPLHFDAPPVEHFTLSNGIPVYFSPDHSLPLVRLFASFKGGPTYFGREDLAAATALGSLLLTGGTASLPPDSIDEVVEYYALAPSAASGGARSQLGIGSLAQHFDVAIELWADMLRHPRFDRDRVEIWRQRQIESVRRFRDLPTSVAITTFNRVMFGDHPIGWTLRESDLTPEHLSDARLRRLHSEIFCPDHAIIGVTGDIERESLRRALESVLAGWPPCPRELAEPPIPKIRRGAGVLLVHRPIDQSTIILGQAGGIVMRDDPDYYASRIANWILGAGGLSSRLVSNLRTEEGLAYQAWSVWTTGTRHERLFGAFTQTRAESTITAAREIREALEALRREPPTREEVRLAIESSTNGFVFAFEDPGDVIARRISYQAAGLPADWLERYLDGIQEVSPEDVRSVIARYIRPSELTLVIVGDTTRFHLPPDLFGPRITQ